MSNIEQIFKNVLKDITPTISEISTINHVVDKLKDLLGKRAREQDIQYTNMEPQGSTGIKQTQLRNDFDIDFFIGLNFNEFSSNYDGLSKNKRKKESKKDFLFLCNEWIIKALNTDEFKNPHLLYAEHPYVKIDYMSDKIDLKVDIVLYFDLTLDYIKKYGPITAVDRSPWHGRFVRDNLTDTQKNDVRLLKQFFKACHSYGDKSAVGKAGFIGYSAELLIYHYKNLQNLFVNFNNLPNKPLDYYNRSIKEIRKKPHMRDDTLIIIDPIDQNRNVASAISERSYRYCNHQIQEFLKNPKEESFQITEIPDYVDMKNDDTLSNNFFIIELKNLNQEIHYTINRDKLYSLGDNIKSNGEIEPSHAKRFGRIEFEVYFEDEIEEYNVAIYCSNPKISHSYLRKGPPTNEKSHVDKFKSKNPDYIEKQGYLWIDTKREFIEFMDFLKNDSMLKLPENFEIINISDSNNVITRSGKKAIYVLRNMVLPFCYERARVSPKS
jgi:tRNA CCA-adding enzyme